jgi:hypothetical protein
MNDQQIRAAALEAACVLSSGALSMDDVLEDERAGMIVSKVAIMADVFREYIEKGTIDGNDVQALMREE